jgi:cleavage stimulation factor subunit 3
MDVKSVHSIPYLFKAEAQIAYLEHYLHPGLFPTAESLFNRFLRPSPSVRLWKFYLTYVR